jgi:hypothetical protein
MALGVIPCLAQIDNGHGEAGSMACTGQLTLQAAHGFHDDQIHGFSCQLGHQRILAFVVIGEGLDTAGNADGSIAGLFGDVDSDMTIASGTFLFSQPW